MPEYTFIPTLEQACILIKHGTTFKSLPSLQNGSGLKGETPNNERELNRVMEEEAKSFDNIPQHRWGIDTPIYGTSGLPIITK